MEDTLEGLHPQLISNIVQSEIEGGLRMDDVPIGGVIRMQTRSRLYIIRKVSETGYTIEGHPEYCATPTEACITGCTWGGSMIKENYIGIGMFLEYKVAGYPVLYSSPIEKVEVS